MLNTYLAATQALLQNPAAPSALYDPAFLTTAINTARNQLAGESECIRALGTINTVLAIRNYNFTSINVGVSATTGIQQVLNVRDVFYTVASGMKWVRLRPWEWFRLFKMNNPVPPSGAPTVWSQFAQGATGSFYLDPIPDLIYVLQSDCVCLPIPLVSDATVEAIPPLWQDAVPYFAAFIALLSAQSGARSADANRMMERYDFFVNRARRFSNSAVNRGLFEQERDPAMMNKLGISQKAAG